MNEQRSPPLPAEIAAALETRRARAWSGTITLHLKDGEVLSYELTEKHRITRETHVSPSSSTRRIQHGEQLPDLERDGRPAR